VAPSITDLPEIRVTLSSSAMLKDPKTGVSIPSVARMARSWSDTSAT
jgi:hypothetical protein